MQYSTYVIESELLIKKFRSSNWSRLRPYEVLKNALNDGVVLDCGKDVNDNNAMV